MLTCSGFKQVDQTTAKMLVNMVEALEAARAPLQHVYFSQGIKYYVRRPPLPDREARRMRAHAHALRRTVTAYDVLRTYSPAWSAVHVEPRLMASPVWPRRAST